VVNLSKKDLTNDHINLLSKGETFVPNNRKPDVSNIMCELKEWERRMRLREYFYDSEKENNDNEANKEW
jgi:ASC-1-like (ASCH) protein